MKKVLTIIAFVFLGILAVITLFPFVYMILAGLMSYSEATSMPPTMFPKQPQWQNYTEVFQKHPFFGISWTQSLFQALQRLLR